MEQVFSSKLSFEEQLASGDTNCNEKSDHKSSSTEESVIIPDMNTELNNLEQEEGGGHPVPVTLSCSSYKLQIKNMIEGKELSNLQSITMAKEGNNQYSIDEHNSEHTDTEIYSDEGHCNQKLVRCADTNASEMEDHPENSNSSNNQSVDEQSPVDHESKTPHVEENRSVDQADIVLTVDKEPSVNNKEHSGDAQCYIIVDRVNTKPLIDEPELVDSSTQDLSIDKNHSEHHSDNTFISDSVKKFLGPGFGLTCVPPVDEKRISYQFSVQYFEAGPIIIVDLPPPDQNERLNQTAVPPPILLVPTTSSVKGDASLSKLRRTEIDMMHVSSILTCQSCYALPITSLTVHICKNGHQVCGHCFGAGYRVCPVCSKPLVGRNACVERFLERLFQLRSDLFVTDSLKIVHSHRPIECPHLRCQRMVASNTGLINHFKFEHLSVQLYHLRYSDPPQVFTLPARCQGDLATRAIALLDVDVGEKDERSRDAVVCLILSCSVAKYTMVAVWCAALYEGKPPLTYRLQANTSTGGELAVTSDVVSLHDSQQIRHVLDNSLCLLMSVEDFNRQCATNSRRQMSLSVSFTLTQ